MTERRGGTGKGTGRLDGTGQIIVIGAGHNGLTCAAYLARKGFAVTVLEASQTVGGAACTREFHPGFRVSAGAHWLYALAPRIERELALGAHGLEYAARDCYTIALDPAGQWLSLADGALGGPGATAADRVAMARLHRRLQRFAGILRGLDHRLPPRLGTRAPRDLLELGRLGLALRRLGREDLREFLRIAGVNVHDLLAETFESELLQGALSLDGTLGAFAGPRSNNTVFHLLNRQNGGRDYDLPRGGLGAVGAALAGAARDAGAEIRLGARVRRILLDRGRATGVELSDGEVLSAAKVVSNADPRSTFLTLLGGAHVEAGFAQRVRQIRQRGFVAKLHLALDDLPGFRGLDEQQHGQRLLIAPSAAAVERAFDAAKYGEYSAQPVFELSVPTVRDPGLAPAGRHVLSANVQWAPYDLRAGWETGREDFLQVCLDRLERYAPGLRGKTRHAELRTPPDLESEFGMAGGHWHHAELGLDRFWTLRPVPGWSRYATPIPGLWLCGAGTHPGGGVSGIPGRNAAMAIAADS